MAKDPRLRRHKPAVYVKRDGIGAEVWSYGREFHVRVMDEKGTVGQLVFTVRYQRKRKAP